MKIYTKTGDDGSTGLFGGLRVSKASARVEAYGTVDELNSALGIVRAHLQGTPAVILDPLLLQIQTQLFVLGADLATPRQKAKSLIDRLDEEAVEELETAIDAHEAELPPLQYFILPGGSIPGSWLHMARTICRRSERVCVLAGSEEDLGETPLIYLNRLSDLLFVLGRRANQLCKTCETPWIPVRKQGKQG